VRVADSGCTVAERHSVQIQRFVEHFALWSHDGYGMAMETDQTHFYTDFIASRVDLAANHTSRRSDAERITLYQAGIPQVAGEDAQAITALFEHTPIRVEKA
jgi:hypothetical protein